MTEVAPRLAEVEAARAVVAQPRHIPSEAGHEVDLKEARRDIAALGHATAVLRLARNFPAVRYLGSERPE